MSIIFQVVFNFKIYVFPKERENKINRLHRGKEEVKLVLFAENIILCIRHLETINTFSKVSGCKISLHKSVVFLHTKHIHTKKEIYSPISNSFKDNRMSWNKSNQ